MATVTESQPAYRRGVPVRRNRTFRRVGAIPASLAAVVAVAVAVGLAWALLVPPWQAPDEDSHFAYAQSLAERFALPGDSTRPGWSDDQGLAERQSDAFSNAHYSAMMRFDWRRLDMATYLAEQRHNPVRSNGGGPNSAAANPPLYYLYADVAYWADSAGNAFDRLYAIRIWNLVLLALTVVAGWLLAGEVFGRARLLQLVCAAIVGLIPMETATAASVSPDALLVGLWTLALWFGVRLIKRPGSSGDAAGLCAVTAAAILTKATSYALVPAVLFALLVWGLRCRAEGREVLRSLGLAVTVLVAPVIAWVELAQSLHRPAINSIAGTGPGRTYPFRFRQLLSYLWQFYFPRLPWLISQRTTEGLPLYEIWVREGWGVFGWLELSMPNWVYAVLTTFTAAVGIRAAGLVVRFRDRVRLSVLVFFALALVSLLAGLHWEEFQSIIQGQGAILQGRYLLPLVGLFGLAVSLVISRLPRRWQGAACGSVLAGLLLVQVVALATVAGRYYT